MRFVTPSFEVNTESHSKSIFSERKVFGTLLTNLVSKSSEALVISLDGKWGEGKTTFVKMWQSMLLESKIPNIYIDAFANDYVDDAFISIVSSITDYAEKNIVKDEKEKIIDLKKKSKEIGCKLLSWSSRIAIKAITLGIIKDVDIDKFEDIKDELSKSASDLVGDFIEERISSHSKDIILIQSFKELLSELPSKLFDGDKPLVVIIDELDRCKPTFAVELLEKIKHFFSVEKVVFLLVMNKEQLEQSIKTIYGQNIDAHTYLQKFINIELKLPKDIIEPYHNDLHKYIRLLLELHELQVGDEYRSLLECIEALAIHFNLSLRQLEKVFTNLSIFYAVSSDKELKQPQALAFLSVVKVINSLVFDDILHGRASFSSIINRLDLTNINPSMRLASVLNTILEFINQCLLSDNEFNQLSKDKIFDGFMHISFSYNINRRDILIFTAKRLNLLTLS